MMPLTLLAALAHQDPAPLRDLRAGHERRYRVIIETESGDRFSYRLGLKIAGSKGVTVEPRLEMRLSDYRATVQGHETKNAKMGGGVLGFAATGLPTGLDISGPQGPFWLPLFTLYLPEGKEDGDFPIAKSPIGPNLTLEGKATFARKDGRATVALDASAVRENKPLGKLTLLTTLSSDGWPRKAEGTLVSADGTYRFTLDRT